MSFMDGKPFVATKQHLEADWYGGANGKYFRCVLCGHRFLLGDIVRFQYTNDVPDAGGNPLVCIKCDGTKEQIVAKMREKMNAMMESMWFFSRIRV
jgi:hypothetical protein